MIQQIFFNDERKELRSGWQVVLFVIVMLFCSLVLESLAVAVTFAMGIDPSALASMNKGTFSWALFQMVSRGLTLISALVASAVCTKFLLRRSFASIGLALHSGWWRDFVIGLFMAALAIAVIALVQWLAGGSRFHKQPITMATAATWLLTIAATLFVAALMEEVIFRGYPLQALARGLHPFVAAALMSAPFGLVHALNPHVTMVATANTVLAGLWLSVAYFKTRSLWLPTGLHLGWNYTMGPIFGLPVSGINNFASLSPIKAEPGGLEWLTGGNYGPEGGLSATIALIVMTILIMKVDLLRVSPEMARFFVKKREETLQ